MKILDEQDREIQESDVDLDLGYLVPEQLFVEHHEAIEEQPEQAHYYPETIYFEDKTKYSVVIEGESDPHITSNGDGVSFKYNNLPGEDEKIVRGMDVKRIVDQEHVEAKKAWDEYEDIQRYKLYTEEELAQRKEEQEKVQKQEEFLASGPDRLTTAETDINDMTLLMADLIGV